MFAAVQGDGLAPRKLMSFIMFSSSDIPAFADDHLPTDPQRPCHHGSSADQRLASDARAPVDPGFPSNARVAEDPGVPADDSTSTNGGITEHLRMTVD